MKISGENKQLLIVIAFFAIVYSLISLVNHYCFRTYALDLGAYTNALYDYFHFQWNDSAVFKELGENLLADHFDLYLIIFSPFSLFFGSYTLLIVQIVFILLGGVGVHRYFLLSEKTNKYCFTRHNIFLPVFRADLCPFIRLSQQCHSRFTFAVVFLLDEKEEGRCQRLAVVGHAYFQRKRVPLDSFCVFRPLV